MPSVPSTPIEIIDVHVFMDRQFPSLRNLKFKLRNKTSKKVIALSMRIGDSSGFEDRGGPYEIEPKGEIPIEEGATAYGDFCSGALKNSMVIMDVSFSDGSKWTFKEPAGSESTKQ